MLDSRINTPVNLGNPRELSILTLAKMIRSIIEQTGVKIDIEDDGTVKIASTDGDSAQKAIEAH